MRYRGRGYSTRPYIYQPPVPQETVLKLLKQSHRRGFLLGIIATLGVQQILKQRSQEKQAL